MRRPSGSRPSHRRNSSSRAWSGQKGCGLVGWSVSTAGLSIGSSSKDRRPEHIMNIRSHSHQQDYSWRAVGHEKSRFLHAAPESPCAGSVAPKNGRTASSEWLRSRPPASGLASRSVLNTYPSCLCNATVLRCNDHRGLAPRRVPRCFRSKSSMTPVHLQAGAFLQDAAGKETST
jgi:hypothetical protein